MTVERSLLELTGKLGLLIRQRLWLQVLIGMFAGVCVGVLIGPTTGLVDPYVAVLVGEVFTTEEIGSIGFLKWLHENSENIPATQRTVHISGWTSSASTELN